MWKTFKTLIGTNGTEDIKTNKVQVAENYMLDLKFKPECIRTKVGSDTIKFFKDDELWKAKIENNPNSDVVITATEEITNPFFWYCLANNKEQLRYLAHIIKLEKRKNNIFQINKNAAYKDYTA